ncbi:thioredoxin domain-containing protein [Saliphagus sp. GCM10025334]|uniref:thioredoxin domain-containing protein n=1 Tax=Natronosalvus halobius TaxID=2953746 RepID=UPI00209FAF07|nr:thioredoxin domain-containing protein [Natronosalvus halobius]USZ70262.1 DsbA family protein [Natronosalvus halobius]
MNVTRRRFAALAAGSALAGAGCLGGGDAESDGNGNGEENGNGGGNGGGNGNGSDVNEDDLLEIPVIGDPDADVTVTVFEDFGCGHCALYHTEIFPDIKEAYVDAEQIRYEHRDFPIPVQEEWSYAVASAARSVQDQEGDEAFFEFTGEIFTHWDDGYSYDLIEQVASDLGFDAEQVRADAEDVTYRDGLEAERAHGMELGIEGTPWIVVDGERVEPDTAAIVGAIDEALAND